MSLVNRVNLFLEFREFFILIHLYFSIQIHLHIGNFDKMLTFCKYYIGFE